MSQTIIPNSHPDDETDTIEVIPMVDEFNDPSVRYAVNGIGLEMTDDQAEAFGLALVAAAHRARSMAKQQRMDWPMEGFPFPEVIFDKL